MKVDISILHATGFAGMVFPRVRFWWVVLLVGGVLWFSGCAPGTGGLVEGECGDGVLNKGEECDLGVFNSDVLPDTCRTNCLLPHCGDMVKDSDEECDGPDLGGATCLTMGFLEGRLSCNEECELDVSECSTCGDGKVSGREECDGDNLDGKTCEDLGFSGGSLLCDSNCNFDVSQCVGGCGNGVREDEEACDLDDLGGQTCESLGFESGTLACNEDCTLDRTGCIGGCGNGVVEEGQVCDDGNDIDYDGCSSDCRAGDGTFDYGRFYETCDVPQDLAAADMNSNGHIDLIVACAGRFGEGGAVAVHLNNGDGTFSASLIYPLDVKLTGIAIGDLDADGIPDVAASYFTVVDSGNPTGGVLVMQGLGDGTLDASQPFKAGTRPMDLALGDFDQDGFLDVVLADAGEQRLQILRGEGDGTFLPDTFLHSFGGPAFVDSADVDGDGIPDIITVRQTYQVGVVFLGLGGGLFSSPISRRTGERPTGVAVGDFNGDVYPDLVFSGAGDGKLSVFLGLGGSEFTHATNFDLETGISGVLAAPIDGDPHWDLVVPGGASDIIWTVLGNGDGTFSQPHLQTPTCDSPVAGVLADFDDDKLWDVAVVCSFSNELGVHIGNEAFPP